MIKTIILIPSRLSATRLPGKPLLKINGISIISHVVKKAREADIGEVYVATEDKEIVEEVNSNGGKAILTNNKHKTGSDRIFECFKKLDIKGIDYIINLQGDMPNLNPKDITKLSNYLKSNKCGLGTLASILEDQKEFEDKNVKMTFETNKQRIGSLIHKIIYLDEFNMDKYEILITDREYGSHYPDLKKDLSIFKKNGWKIVSFGKRSDNNFLEKNYLEIFLNQNIS